MWVGESKITFLFFSRSDTTWFSTCFFSWTTTSWASLYLVFNALHSCSLLPASSCAASLSFLASFTSCQAAVTSRAISSCFLRASFSRWFRWLISPFSVSLICSYSSRDNESSGVTSFLTVSLFCKASTCKVFWSSCSLRTSTSNSRFLMAFPRTPQPGCGLQ